MLAGAALSEACCSADSGQMLREFAGRSARGQARGGLQPLHREVSRVVMLSLTGLLHFVQSQNWIISAGRDSLRGAQLRGGGGKQVR